MSTWVTPHDFVNGEAPDEAVWDASIGGNTNFLHDAHTCRAYRSSAAGPLSSASENTITFDQEAYDSDNIHSTTTLTSRFTVPVGLDGKWRITAGALPTPNGNGGRFLMRLRKNGTDFAFGGGYIAGSGSSVPMEASSETTAVAGDFFELVLRQDTGASMALSVGPSSLWMVTTWIGA